MNLNLSKILKENSFSTRDAQSINNWIRVLDTSGMTVVDQLILDNHRRQLLKALHQPDSLAKEKSFCRSSKKFRSASAKKTNLIPDLKDLSQIIDTKEPRASNTSKDTSFQIPTCNITWTSSADASICVERLYSDAHYRDMKLKKLKEEKEIKEFNEAIESANSRHPKRKLDPEVFNRLTSDERVIRSLYEKDQNENTQRRQFSASEQKASVDRLYKTRGSSCSRNEDSQMITRKLQQDELDSLIGRLYKVNKPGESEQISQTTRSYFNNQVLKAKNSLALIKNKKNNRKKPAVDLKSSKRYVESQERLSELTVETCSEYEKNFENKENKPNLFQYPNDELKLRLDSSKIELELLPRCQKNPFMPAHPTSPPSISEFTEDDLKICELNLASNRAAESSIDQTEVPAEVKAAEMEETTEIKIIIEEIKDKLIPSDTIITASTEILITRSPESIFDQGSDSFSPSSYIAFNPSSDTTITLSPNTSFISCETLSNFDSKPASNLNPSSCTMLSHEKQEKMEMDISLQVTQSFQSNLSGISKPEQLKSLPFPRSMYLEPEDSSSRVQTTFSQESLYLMQNPLQSLPSRSSPKSSARVLDSYRFIVGITEDDEFIYAD